MSTMLTYFLVPVTSLETPYSAALMPVGQRRRFATSLDYSFDQTPKPADSDLSKTGLAAVVCPPLFNGLSRCQHDRDVDLS
ncbi:hypothetical protein FHX15_000673 [Rhizobium sp. BK650]|nr:hypothetical protein [Rhizobium sp. BK650]